MGDASVKEAPDFVAPGLTPSLRPASPAPLFQGVFQKVDLDAIGKFEDKYKGGEEERSDVINYYVACGGDGRKMLSCVMCSLPEDKPRWVRDILGPAIGRGDVEDLGFKNFGEQEEREVVL